MPRWRLASRSSDSPSACSSSSSRCASSSLPYVSVSSLTTSLALGRVSAPFSPPPSPPSPPSPLPPLLPLPTAAAPPLLLLPRPLPPAAFERASSSSIWTARPSASAERARRCASHCACHWRSRAESAAVMAHTGTEHSWCGHTTAPPRCTMLTSTSPGSSAGCLPLGRSPGAGAHCGGCSGKSRGSRATTSPRGSWPSRPSAPSGSVTKLPAAGSRCSTKGDGRTRPSSW
mmetsp:Transcript_35349/g.113059  ORF Transcript_35349/g.113059 Transcript_35349/m.113059 type:complete len:231 (+) Transcript_35349:153-845(+)